MPAAAQLERFGGGGDAESADAAADGVVRDRDGAVTVGVGFDDEHDARAGCRTCGG